MRSRENFLKEAPGYANTTGMKPFTKKQTILGRMVSKELPEPFYGRAFGHPSIAMQPASEMIRYEDPARFPVETHIIALAFFILGLHSGKGEVN
jgi:hypothetical protein